MTKVTGQEPRSQNLIFYIFVIYIVITQKYKKQVLVRPVRKIVKQQLKLKLPPLNGWQI